MRAWLLHDTTGPDALSLEEVEEPQPQAGQVRVAVKVAGLNHLDLWVSRGLPAPNHLPHILGADAAGIVDALGEGVAAWEVGDEVIVNPSMSCGQCHYCLRDQMVFCRSYQILGEHDPGTLAEMVVLPARSLIAKPPTLDWPTAGTFGLAAGTAYRMLLRARLQPHETVLVVGVGGGVSSAAMLIALAMGARVFVTSRSPDKIDWAIEQGAEGGFDSGGEFAKELKNAAGGADVVVENVGDATWGQSLRSLSPGGRLVLCGATAGNRVELALPVLWFKQLEIIGSTMFTRSEFARVLHLVESGKVRIPVDRVFPFEDLPAALAHLDAGDQIGKVGLELS
ncbi:MAG TPA: zinc-binding dehydrogenase [Acidimicrobiia bacterium]|nr:zinc-binding dehydrogenase [Acidimicrobiia bacterium]